MVDIKRKPKPRILFEENVGEFNKMAAEGKIPDLAGHNLSDLDLRGFQLRGVDLSNCYLRGTNLSGVDLSDSLLDGASIRNATISGCFFPRDLPAEEIKLSLATGIRMRHKKNKE